MLNLNSTVQIKCRYRISCAQVCESLCSLAFCVQRLAPDCAACRSICCRPAPRKLCSLARALRLISCVALHCAVIIADAPRFWCSLKLILFCDAIANDVSVALQTVHRRSDRQLVRRAAAARGADCCVDALVRVVSAHAGHLHSHVRAIHRNRRRLLSRCVFLHTHTHTHSRKLSCAYINMYLDIRAAPWPIRARVFGKVNPL